MDLDLRRVILIATLAGITLGVGDLEVMTHVAYPWANLANSSAVWAIGAFVLGALLRTDPVRSAIAGVVMMVVAVEAYYGYAALADLSASSTMWSEHAVTWMVFGVFAGVIFGVAGAWTNSDQWWQRVAGTAAGAGVLIGEGLHTFSHIDATYGSFHTDLGQSAAAMMALGVVVLLAAARRPVVLVAAAVATVPCAIFSAAAFTAVGISF
jgi:hypothetical protein